VIAQQKPPPGGYTIELFESYLDEMSRRVDEMRTNMDARAIFEITYLVFSRQVLAALKANRFEDMAWATDMACRFIEVYKEQLSLWNSQDPMLCRPWRVAFEAMAEGRVNVLQAMLLGINAHINYDLAFVTLGSSRAMGDLIDEAAPERALSASRTGIPVVRYRDFLVINQLEWEAIELIQDTVLQEYNRALYWMNRASLRFTRFLGQRILMEARDQAWYQTTMLVHAREDERELLARAIDNFAASMADLIGSLSYRPDLAVENAIGWTRRWDRLDPQLQSAMVNLACRNAVIAELVLRELAFAGAEPISVLETLLSRGEPHLAGMYARWALRLSPRRRRVRLERYLESGSDSAMTVLTAMVDSGLPRSALPKSHAIEAVRRRWSDELRANTGCLELAEIRSERLLADAIFAHASAIRKRLETFGGPLPPSKTTPLTLPEARALIASHPSRWVRLCAQANDGEDMASLIEKVLFLKETQVFMEVDIAVLLHVAEKLENRSLLAGQSVVKAGEKSGGLYLINKGQVEVTQPRKGKNLRITVLGPRDSIGELSALNDTPATADCTALTPMECYFLPSAVLANLLHQHPRLSIGLIRMLSHRLTHTTLRVSDPPPPPETVPPPAMTADAS
jgi:CRP-like cAMP-binding protein